MKIDNPDPIPRLTIVAGRPGAGKTTLARKLANDIRCPLISRDRIKEGIVNTTGDKGEPGGTLAWDVYETFFATIELLLRNHVTLVAEAAFQHKLWAPKLEPLREHARIRIVLCQLDAQLAYARAEQRRQSDKIQDRFHNPLLDPSKQTTNYAPPHLDLPILIVDTSNHYEPSYADILNFAMDASAVRQ